MYREKTVYILGAGASWHYGYPTGELLVNLVSRKAAEIQGFFSESPPASFDGIPKYLEEKLTETERSNPSLTRSALSREWINIYHQSGNLLKRLKGANPLVIDYFLGQNPQLAPLGKMLTAWVILECESKFSGKQLNSNRKDVDQINFYTNDDWIRFIQHEIVSELTRPEDILDNPLTFITFNYDMSLETRLYSGIKNLESYEEVADEFMNTIPFLHIYGQIRQHTSTQPKSIPVLRDPRRPAHEYYRVVLDAALESSMQLRTIDPNDKGLEASVLGKAVDALEAADKIYILGFGFDKNNCDRLQMSRTCDLAARGARTKKILFTNFRDHNRINKRASSVFFQGPTDYLFDEWLIKRSHGICEKSTKDVYQALAYDFE